MGQGSSQLLTHTWIMNGPKTMVYNRKKNEKKGGKKNKGKKGRLKKYNSKKERKNSKLLITLLGHNRGRFLPFSKCNSSPLTRITDIFSLDSD